MKTLRVVSDESRRRRLRRLRSSTRRVTSRDFAWWSFHDKGVVMRDVCFFFPLFACFPPKPARIITADVNGDRPVKSER